MHGRLLAHQIDNVGAPQHSQKNVPIGFYCSGALVMLVAIMLIVLFLNVTLQLEKRVHKVDWLVDSLMRNLGVSRVALFQAYSDDPRI